MNVAAQQKNYIAPNLTSVIADDSLNGVIFRQSPWQLPIDTVDVFLHPANFFCVARSLRPWVELLVPASRVADKSSGCFTDIAKRRVENQALVVAAVPVIIAMDDQ